METVRRCGARALLPWGVSVSISWLSGGADLCFAKSSRSGRNFVKEPISRGATGHQQPVDHTSPVTAVGFHAPGAFSLANFTASARSPACAKCSLARCLHTHNASSKYARDSTHQHAVEAEMFSERETKVVGGRDYQLSHGWVRSSVLYLLPTRNRHLELSHPIWNDTPALRDA